MMLDLGEPIGFLYHHSDLEAYALWSLTCPEKVVAFLDRAMRHYRLVYERTLALDLADVYFLVGSELASPPLVSRATFQSWIVPYAAELIARIHAYGARSGSGARGNHKYAIQHYHGQIRHILPDFLTMAPDALHTIESPATGNCTISQAYDVLGNRITLIGNIQYDLFRSLTPAEMRDEVRRVLDEAAGRRFILSPSAGPYEETISPRMIENYLAFLDAGWDFGAR
jgi:uroporphyrinogen-III decarboxylase